RRDRRLPRRIQTAVARSLGHASASGQVGPPLADGRVCRAAATFARKQRGIFGYAAARKRRPNARRPENPFLARAAVGDLLARLETSPELFKVAPVALGE